MAQYLCREIRRHLEELKEEQQKGVPGDWATIQDLERHLLMKSEQMIATLKGLEASIEAQDVKSMLEYETFIDSLADYLDGAIDGAERSEVTGRSGARRQRLKAWRESAGKLAQLLCQID
jgi:hypothetical protein